MKPRMKAIAHSEINLNSIHPVNSSTDKEYSKWP